MSKLKATPGPYSARPSVINGDIGITAPGVRNVIAECYEDMRFDNERSNDEALANAQLFMASWEMYDALQRARHAMEFALTELMNSTNEDYEQMKHDLQLVDDALAKARGEQP